MLRRDLSLRTRILLAIVGAVVATDLLATLAIQVRFVDGARREAHNQAASRVAMARALYAERAATLAADAERIALYPAVIAAVEGRNAQPLLRWGTDVAARQGIHVKVVDATGATIAHGHTHERLGPRWDGLVTAAPLEGMQLALGGRTASGVEASDEIGLAVRGYAPVRREDPEGPASGPVVGAVMLADPLDAPLLAGVAGGGEVPGALRVEPLGALLGASPGAVWRRAGRQRTARRRRRAATRRPGLPPPPAGRCCSRPPGARWRRWCAPCP